MLTRISWCMALNLEVGKSFISYRQLVTVGPWHSLEGGHLPQDLFILLEHLAASPTLFSVAQCAVVTRLSVSSCISALE